jgi:hypothetical protein
MTGPEHYREAERLAKLAGDYDGLPNNHHIQAGQLSQAHATLALTEAYVAGAVMRPEDRDEWDRATGRLERAPTTAGTGE